MKATGTRAKWESPQAEEATFQYFRAVQKAAIARLKAQQPHLFVRRVK